MLDLRLSSARVVRINAPAARASTSRSIAVTGAGLDTVRVVHDQVVDIVVEIRVSLPGYSTADTGSCMHRAVMLRVRPGEWSSTRCRVDDDSKLVRRVETVHRGVRPLKLGAVRVEMLMVA